MRYYNLPHPPRPAPSEKNFASAIKFIRLGDIVRTLVHCGRVIPSGMFRKLNDMEDNI